MLGAGIVLLSRNPFTKDIFLTQSSLQSGKRVSNYTDVKFPGQVTHQ